MIQDLTIQTYKENFESYKEKTPNEVSGEFIGLLDDFIQLLPKSAKVFELGSAQGRDARYLRDKGVTVLCTDVIPQALEDLRADNFETSVYDFRDTPKSEWVDSFDGVLAKAVYVHATQEVFEKSLVAMGTLVRVGGVLCSTFKLGSGDEVETEKLGGVRYFKYYSEKELETIVKQYKQFELVDMKVTSDGKWVQMVVRRCFQNSEL